MLFNTIDFGVFLCIVYSLYWLIGIKKRKLQNLLLLVASYCFYAIWDWWFLGLLIGSSLLDYLIGVALSKSEKISTRTILVGTSIFWNIGVLILFKYFNFFLEGFYEVFNISEGSEPFWNIAIPVGLSFYTFQTLGYSIDVYRKSIKPTKNILTFLCFVSFFPQLVAGPIEKAKKLIPQFETNRTFNLQSSKEGLRRILWGLFKKVIVADQLGVGVSMVFENPEAHGGLMVVYASLLFFFQLYCDFSGYTDIAIGSARLFGFKLSENFKLPYLSISITEFWQRWHITLTLWFTNYIYIPFYKKNRMHFKYVKSIGLIITMMLIGIWHGANYTFLLFGFVNAIVLLIERNIMFKNGISFQKKLYRIPRIFSLLYFFSLAMLVSFIFRLDDINNGILMVKEVFNYNHWSISSLIGMNLTFLIVLIVFEVFTKNKSFPLEALEKKVPKFLRWSIYYTLIYLIARYNLGEQSYIYFQF